MTSAMGVDRNPGFRFPARPTPTCPCGTLLTKSGCPKCMARLPKCDGCGQRGTWRTTLPSRRGGFVQRFCPDCLVQHRNPDLEPTPLQDETAARRREEIVNDLLRWERELRSD